MRGNIDREVAIILTIVTFLRPLPFHCRNGGPCTGVTNRDRKRRDLPPE
jgi:hypothetical protein